jgi:hypothetical protein
VGNYQNMKHTLFIISFGLTRLLSAQSIDIGDMMINENISYSSTIDELRKADIDIDSIKPIPEIMDMSMADSLVYFGRTYFEYYANSNKCILNVVQFDSKITKVKIDNITFSKQTTFESIQQNFPEDCQSVVTIKVYQDQKSYTTCGIPISLNGQLIDSRLLFFFLDGKLSRIDIWEPS